MIDVYYLMKKTFNSSAAGIQTSGASKPEIRLFSCLGGDQWRATLTCDSAALLNVLVGRLKVDDEVESGEWVTGRVNPPRLQSRQLDRFIKN